MDSLFTDNPTRRGTTRWWERGKEEKLEENKRLAISHQRKTETLS
jgi:hypothetical protein